MSRPDMSTVPGEFGPTKNFSFQDNQVIGNSLKTETYKNISHGKSSDLVIYITLIRKNRVMKSTIIN